jgi:hypothetical protein
MIIAAAIVTAGDLLTQRLAMNSTPRQIMRRIASAPTSIDVLGIGNSLMGAGFDPSAVERSFQESNRSCVAINGALGATGVIEHLAVARFAMRHHTVNTLIYGFFDQQLSSDVVGKNSDIIGNRSILYYLEPELTLKYARFDTLNRFSFQLCRSLALLRERGTIWEKIEKLRRSIGSIGMPPQEFNQYGRKADFAMLEASDAEDFALACRRVIESGDFLSAPVQALLEQAREHGAKVIVVEMPMPPLHLKQFYDQPIWEKFRMKTRLALEGSGATYLNASAWIPDDALFADHLHLSDEGARQFSQLLARQLVHQQN